MLLKVPDDIRFWSADPVTGWLSAFYPTPFRASNGIVYPTIEHYYQSMKSACPVYRKRILACRTPGQAKREAQRCKLRRDWATAKIHVMRKAIHYAYTQNPKQCAKLLQTDSANLVHVTTWHDTYWGICTCNRCSGKGYNQMGRLLMRERNILKHELVESYVRGAF